MKLIFIQHVLIILISNCSAQHNYYDYPNQEQLYPNHPRNYPMNSYRRSQSTRMAGTRSHHSKQKYYYYNTQKPQSNKNMLVVHYPVPVLIFPMNKGNNTTNSTKAETKEEVKTTTPQTTKKNETTTKNDVETTMSPKKELLNVLRKSQHLLKESDRLNSRRRYDDRLDEEILRLLISARKNYDNLRRKTSVAKLSNREYLYPSKIDNRKSKVLKHGPVKSKLEGFEKRRVMSLKDIQRLRAQFEDH